MTPKLIKLIKITSKLIFQVLFQPTPKLIKRTPKLIKHTPFPRKHTKK